MEEEKKLPVKVSEIFNHDLDDIYKYGIDTPLDYSRLAPYHLPNNR